MCGSVTPCPPWRISLHSVSVTRLEMILESCSTCWRSHAWDSHPLAHLSSAAEQLHNSVYTQRGRSVFMSARGVPAGDLSKAKRSPRSQLPYVRTRWCHSRLACVSGCTPTQRNTRVVHPNSRRTHAHKHLTCSQRLWQAHITIEHSECLLWVEPTKSRNLLSLGLTPIHKTIQMRHFNVYLRRLGTLSRGEEILSQVCTWSLVWAMHDSGCTSPYFCIFACVCQCEIHVSSDLFPAQGFVRLSLLWLFHLRPSVS